MIENHSRVVDKCKGTVEVNMLDCFIFMRFNIIEHFSNFCSVTYHHKENISLTKK